jgi:hypothetical protein
LNGRRVAAAATVTGAVLAAGCDPLSPRIFVAAAWNDDLACLEEGGAVDVFDDETVADCDDSAKCWRSPDDVVFVSRQCEAPPGWDRLEADDDDRCTDALLAWDRGKDGRCDA